MLDTTNPLHSADVRPTGRLTPTKERLASLSEVAEQLAGDDSDHWDAPAEDVRDIARGYLLMTDELANAEVRIRQLEADRAALALQLAFRRADATCDRLATQLDHDGDLDDAAYFAQGEDIGTALVNTLRKAGL